MREKQGFLVPILILRIIYEEIAIYCLTAMQDSFLPSRLVSVPGRGYEDQEWCSLQILIFHQEMANDIAYH
jgi:hypothetical protein